MNSEYLAIIDRFSGLRALVIGDAMLDVYLDGAASRICREAPVPIVDVQAMKAVPGGAANTAVNLAQLGAKVDYVSVVGCDHEAGLLRKALEQCGVQTLLLMGDPERRTLAKQRVAAGSQLLLRFDSGSTNPLGPQNEQRIMDVLEDRFHRVDAVIVSDYGYGILTDRIIDLLGQLQRKKENLLIIDAKSLDKYRHAGATAAKPNYQEMVALLGITEPAPCGHRCEQIKRRGRDLLEKTGAKYVAATMDIEGALLFRHGQEPYRTFSRPVENSKAAGAGDTYVSALSLGLASGASVEAAAEIAKSAAAVILQKAGTATCTQDELRYCLSSGNKYAGDWRQLKDQLDAYRKDGRRVVFTNGCFDLLHSGHVAYLEQARTLGDVLVLALNSDASIRRLKGSSRPINNLYERIRILSGLESVTLVTSFEEDTPLGLLEVIRPDVYVKGGDYTVESLPEAPLVLGYGGKVEIMPFVQDHSTTSLITRIRSLDRQVA